MTKLAFDEDRDLALAQPSVLVKMAATFSLIGALLGGTGALQLSSVLSRMMEPPIWAAASVYGGIFLAPLLAFAGAKVYRLAPWAPVTAVVLGAVSTLLGFGQLAFMLKGRFVICMGVLGPTALSLGTIASIVALASAHKSIAARKRLSDEGIELGV